MKTKMIFFSTLSVLLFFLWGCGDTIDKLEAYPDYLFVSGIDGNLTSSSSQESTTILDFSAKDSTMSIVIHCEDNKQWKIIDINEPWLIINRDHGSNGDTIEVKARNYVKHPEEIRKAAFIIKVGERKQEITVIKKSIDVELIVAPQEINLEKKKNRIGKINIICNTQWIPEPQKDWYAYSPQKGELGTQSLDISGDVYEGDTTRNDILIIYPSGYRDYPELRREVKISQDPEPYFYPSDSKISLSNKKPKREIKIFVNVNWNEYYPDEDAWYSFSYKKESATVTTLTITINENNDLSPKNETVQLLSNDNRVDPIELEIEYVGQ